MYGSLELFFRDVELSNISVSNWTTFRTSKNRKMGGRGEYKSALKLAWTIRRRWCCGTRILVCVFSEPQFVHFVGPSMTILFNCPKLSKKQFYYFGTDRNLTAAICMPPCHSMIFFFRNLMRKKVEEPQDKNKNHWNRLVRMCGWTV